jgi:3-oxoadipate enol-lactonase
MLRYRTVRTRRDTGLSVLALGPDDGGVREPVLLVHPINLRKECWLDLVRVLGADRLCVAPDLAGHGESGDDPDAGLAGWVADCLDVVAAAGLDRFHVVGGSLGGTIALCLASELPGRVLSVTAIGSALGGDEDGEADLAALLDTMTTDQLFDTLAVEALAPGAAAEVVATVRALTNTHGADMVRRILSAAQRADAAPWVPGVECPVLVLTGEYDTTCPPQAGARMASRTRGRHEVLLGTGHLPMFEDPAAVLRHLVPQLRTAKAVAR